MAKIAEEYRADIAWHTKRADMFRKDAAAAIGVRHDWYMKRANEEEMAAIIIEQNLAEMLAKSERTADSKTDNVTDKQKKLPRDDLTRRTIQYVNAHRKKVKSNKVEKMDLRDLVAEYVGDKGDKVVEKIYRALMPDRHGHHLIDE